MSSEPCKATVLSQIAFSHAAAEVVGMCDRKDLEAGHSSVGWSIGCLVPWFPAWLVDAGGAVCIVCLFGNLFGVL